MALRWSVWRLGVLRNCIAYSRRQTFGTTTSSDKLWRFGISNRRLSSRALDRILQDDIVQDKDSPVFAEQRPVEPSLSCPGCGAELQADVDDEAGFIPGEKLTALKAEVEKSQHVVVPPSIVCRRCYWLRHYGQAMNIEVNEDEYRACLSRLRSEDALVLWLVDVTDFPVSLYAGLADLIGRKNPVVLVGNKIDLLRDAPMELQKRTRNCLINGWKSSGLDKQCMLKAVHVISAETGFGVSQLAEDILAQWNNQGDIYLVGCANSGKSTLFNALLPLMCGIPLGSKQGATISRWPGTTLRLVSFPVFSKGKRQRLRQQVLKALVRRAHEEYDLPGMANPSSLKSAGAMFSSKEDEPAACCYTESELEDMFSRKSAKRRKLSDQVQNDEQLQKIVEEKYSHLLEDDSQLDPSLSVQTEVSERGKSEPPHRKVKMEARTVDNGEDKKELHDEESFFEELEDDIHKKDRKQVFLHDTPGLLNPAQLLLHLSTEELRLVVPKSPLKPLTLLLKPGHCFFIGGLARVDYVEGKHSVYFSVLCSHMLPIHRSTVNKADEVYHKHAGHQVLLKVPSGGDDRMKTFPALKSKSVCVTGIGWDKSCADVILSSAGWTAVTAHQGEKVTLHVHTPNGLGICTRQPLLPFAVQLRGKRRKSGDRCLFLGKPRQTRRR